LRASGAVVEIDHPTRGKHLTVGNPVKLSDSLCVVTRAPLLGEHTREILRKVLDLSDDQIGTLEEAGAFGEHGAGE
jgi:formyl-CoA transferase